jgi:rhamnosyltransferase
MVTTLMAEYLSHERPPEVAIIGCNFTNSVSKKAFYEPDSKARLRKAVVKYVITSGSLVSLRAYRQLGGFRDEFFMDCVDVEYCLRARAGGFRVLRVSKQLMEHSIGQLTEHRLLWKETGTSNHSPMRRYYMMRNSLILAREYLLKEPGWVVATLWSKVKLTLLVALYEQDRLTKLRYSALGFFDGLMGNTTRFA